MKKIPEVAIIGNIGFLMYIVPIVLALFVNPTCPECYLAGIIKGSTSAVELQVSMTLAVLFYTVMSVGFQFLDNSTEVSDKIAIWGMYMLISQMFYLYIPALVHFTTRVISLVIS